MGKAILYAGILWAALGCSTKSMEGHLFAFRYGKDIRADIRQAQAECEENVFRRLGEKKYLIREGERVVMLDTEKFAEERIINRELVERIEREATEKLQKTRGKEGFRRI